MVKDPQTREVMGTTSCPEEIPLGSIILHMQYLVEDSWGERSSLKEWLSNFIGQGYIKRLGTTAHHAQSVNGQDPKAIYSSPSPSGWSTL